MNAIRRAGLILLIGALAASLWVLATRPVVQAQTAGSADGIVQVIANMNEREQILYHIDAAKQKILVFQLIGQVNPPKMQLLAARDFRYDVQVDEYNNTGLHYFEIRDMVIKQEERERLLREIREKKGLPAPKEEELPAPPAIPAIGGGNQIIAVVGNIRKDEQVLYLTHTGKRRMCVYWFHTTTKKLEFIAARTLEWDVELRDLNTDGPKPDDIANQIRREKALWEQRQKNGGGR
ncbi:MAG: hypothetical protein AAB215_02125 [Planctomycetota bacterium]